MHKNKTETYRVKKNDSKFIFIFIRYLKQLVYKLGIGVFIVSGYVTEGHTSKNKLNDFEDQLKTESAVIPAAHDKENLESSRDQLKKAVNQGNISEVLNLKEIFCYCKKESKKGKIEEQGLLAFLYMKGWGVKKSHEKARLWAEKAALREDPVALRILGTLHKKGRAVEKSIPRAMELFEKSALLGHGPAQNKLGCIYAKQEGSESNAVEWLKLAAGQNHPVGQRNLGLMYITGKGVKQSNEKGVFWYKQAAVQGLASAQNDLGWMYSKGHGVELSPEEAVKYYQQAADRNHILAIMNLVEAYQHGVGVEQSLDKSIGLCERAVKLNHKSALEKLEELKKQRNAKKSAKKLAEEISGKKLRKKNRNRKRHNKSNFTSPALVAPLVHKTSVSKEQAPSDAVEAEISESQEPIQSSKKQLIRSKKKKSQKQEGKLIGDILLSSNKKKLKKDKAKQEEPLIPIEKQNEKTDIPTETSLGPKQEAIPLEEFSPKKPLEPYLTEKEEPKSAQDDCVMSSNIPMSALKEEENSQKLQSHDDSCYVGQLVRQIGCLRQRNMGLNQRYGNLVEAYANQQQQYNLLYWQHMGALKEIDELRKQNAELKKQNVVLVFPKIEPREEPHPQ
ncbi:MAG: hypothetical protein BGO67_09720 [Alphaproteobacteria bacterium 41-28]|nr:MAG: hypothetical protein BGO67_09720 [Alphaproteobacteria bacterium 41-28]